MLTAIERALMPAAITLAVLLLGNWLGARRRLINELKRNYRVLWLELGSPEVLRVMMFREIDFVRENSQDEGGFRKWFSEKSYLKLKDARVTMFARRLELVRRIFFIETGLFIGYGILRAYFS
jgi:hypothetical protein